jgi:hypothetical protein
MISTVMSGGSWERFWIVVMSAFLIVSVAVFARTAPLFKLGRWATIRGFSWSVFLFGCALTSLNIALTSWVHAAVILVISSFALWMFYSIRRKVRG